MPVAFCVANSSRPSSASHVPSSARTLFATRTWVWSCGSAAREVRWTKPAATSPSVSTWRTPLWPRRVKAAWSSRNASDCGDRRFVRRKDLVGDRLVADRPQRRDALRWREREREAGDCALVVGIEAAPERGTRRGIGSVAEEPLELATGRLVVRDPEGLGAAAEEAAGTLRALREIVLAAPHDLLGVVAPGRGRHRREAHHRRGAPATPRIGDAAVSSCCVRGATSREYIDWGRDEKRIRA